MRIPRAEQGREQSTTKLCSAGSITKCLEKERGEARLVLGHLLVALGLGRAGGREEGVS